MYDLIVGCSAKHVNFFLFVTSKMPSCIELFTCKLNICYYWHEVCVKRLTLYFFRIGKSYEMFKFKYIDYCNEFNSTIFFLSITCNECYSATKRYVIDAKTPGY